MLLFEMPTISLISIFFDTHRVPAGYYGDKIRLGFMPMLSVKSSKVGFTKIDPTSALPYMDLYFRSMPTTLGFTLHIIKDYSIHQRLNYFENGY